MTYVRLDTFAIFFVSIKTFLYKFSKFIDAQIIFYSFGKLAFCIYRMNFTGFDSTSIDIISNPPIIQQHIGTMKYFHLSNC